MRIRAKAVLILTVSTAVIGASLVAISAIVLRSGFLALEERHALKDLERVRRACDQRLAGLGRSASDWARRDDSWRFLQGANPGFASANLSDETFAALDADVMVFLARDGSLVHERLLPRFGLELPPGAVQALRESRGAAPPPPRDAPALTRTGVIRLPGAPLLFASHPVYRSDGSGPPAGHFFIGRFLDAGRLAELGADVGFALSIVDPGTLPPGVTASVRRPGGDRLLVQGLFTDPGGAPAFAIEATQPRELFSRGAAAVRTFLALSAGVGLAVVAVSLLALHRGVLARVESLGEQVRRIGEGSGTGREVTVGGGDELSDLAAAINQMLHSLERADEALAFSERLAAVGTLASGVAHQFNNINTGLLNYAEIALARPGLDEATRGHLEQIVKGVMRSAAVTRGLLAFSGEIQQAPLPCRLDEVAAESLPMLSRELTRHAITLESRLVAVPAVRMDPALIQQVVLNLVLNAIHAVVGRPERRIEVETSADAAHVRLAVHDTGCGIAPGDLPQLFTPFFSRKGERARRGTPQERVTGTGLGLSVSYAIVKRHGGRIEAQSTEGAGSTFTVLLPRLS